MAPVRLPLDLPTQVALRLVRAWTDESGEFRTYEDPTPSPTNSTTPERLVNMPENVADIYIKMMYALVGLWFVGVAATLSYSCKNFDTCTDKKRKQLSLRASLYGISNTPVPLRFGRNQGDRWVNICSFGLTVSALANLTATLLLGPLELGGPGGLFYFYSYFLIFLAFGAIYWPMFISRNQVHRRNGRIYGLCYSGLMLTTVFIASIFNSQPRAYALTLNAPYLLCSTLVFFYFIVAMYRHRFWNRHAASTEAGMANNTASGRASTMTKDGDVEHAHEEDSSYVKTSDGRRLRLNDAYFDIEVSYVRGLLLGPRRLRAKALDIKERLADEKKRSWAARTWTRFVTWFRLPAKVRLGTRLLIGTIMAVEVAYVIGVVLCFYFFQMALQYIGEWPNVPEDMVESLYLGTSIAGASLAFLIVIGQTMLTYSSFTEHILRLRKGDYSMVPGGRAAKFDINDAIGFIGFSMGYGLVGYVYMFIILELLMIFCWAIVYLEDVRQFFWNELVKELLFLPVLSVTIFVQIQRLVSRKVFLPDKGVSRFWTTKSALFTHYEYFMVFINAMRGIISFLYSRLLIPLGFMVLFSTRLDKSMMVEGLEWMDEGFCNYIGMILADHHSNNPVVVLFVESLTISLENRIADGHFVPSDEEDEEGGKGNAKPGDPNGGASKSNNASTINADDELEDEEEDAVLRSSVTSPLLIQKGGQGGGGGSGAFRTTSGSYSSSNSVPMRGATPPLVMAPTAEMSSSAPSNAKESSITAVTSRDPRLARNRWLLAFTLLNNPSVREHRKLAIVERRAAAEALAQLALETNLALPSGY